MDERPRRYLPVRLLARHFHAGRRTVGGNPIALAIKEAMPDRSIAIIRTGHRIAHFESRDGRILGSAPLPDEIAGIAVAFEDCGNADFVRKGTPIRFGLNVPAAAMMVRDRYGRIVESR